MAEQGNVVVKTYKGTEKVATELFQEDAPRMAAEGYYPTTQTYAPGSYGCGTFVLALLLCFLLVGIVIFIYMLLVKPPGVLSVTYELRSPIAKPESDPEKICPRCAERVKAAAKVCRFCGYEFS